ncbi:MAG: type II toxin-antitoxin system VapC family toxin [Lachnospiraceae bacterium]|nr:type II toxin-antitoxin system VapC family toxin [Lachnospiraceae bacterium]
MNILMDTHIAVWALTDDKRLKAKARDILLDPVNHLYYSALSVFEVDLKSKSRHNNLAFTAEDFTDMCRKAGYHLSPLTDAHITGANHLTWTGAGREHHDPFDRILLAQAIAENMHLMTGDTAISGFKQNCVILV